MIENLILTKVFINDKSKDGTAFVAKTGKKYWKIAVMCDKKEYEGKYLSSFIFDEDDIRMSWKVGYKVNVVVEHNGEWLNFKMPTETDYLVEEVRKLSDRVTSLEEYIKGGNLPHDPNMEPPIQAGNDEINVENLPF